MEVQRVNIIYPKDLELAADPNRTELPPLGVLYVAASLEKEGFSVKVVGIDQNTNQLPESDVDGLALITTATYPIIREFSKRALPERSTIKIGGNTHATIFPEKTLQELKLDVVVRGEAEEVLPQLLKNLSIVDTIQEAAKGLSGLTFINESVDLISDPTINRIKDINKLAFPARHLMDNDSILLENRLVGAGKLVTTLITSRGCPFSCLYCANLNNKSFRTRSEDNIRTEIETILEQYPQCEGLLIMDENLTLSPRHVSNFAKAITGTGLEYVISGRADHMTKNMAGTLVQSGCLEVKFGIETGSPWLLKRMGKEANLEEFEEGVRTAAKAGLSVKLFLMHGFPGENEKTTSETIDMLKELESFIGRATLYQFTPLPGSPIWHKAKEFNLHLKEKGLKDFRIYKNNTHWWGTEKDHRIVQEQYERLKGEIIHLFGKVN